MKMCRSSYWILIRILYGICQDSPNIIPVKGFFSEIRSRRAERTLRRRNVRQVRGFTIGAPVNVAIQSEVLQPLCQLYLVHRLLGSHGESPLISHVGYYIAFC